jgi:hypothetical protein
MQIPMMTQIPPLAGDAIVTGKAIRTAALELTSGRTGRARASVILISTRRYGAYPNETADVLLQTSHLRGTGQPAVIGNHL